MSDPASPDPAQTCIRCGATIAADAPNGVCPACLMAEVMQPAQAAIVDEGSLPTMPASRPTSSQPRNAVPDLPLPEELTALLPHGMYKVEGFLGQGGMGAVYKGTHIRLKRPVAIKIMHSEAGRDYDFAQRFEREAQAMARLSHPNIVGVFDYGEAGPDYLYIVMELVDGADLMDVIRTGRMTQEMALTLLPQICDALQFAHDHSIVHRDIKPSNIMLTRDGRVKMCDFGLAKRYDVESSFRTQTGTGMGTPDYAAPEQFKEGAPIDHRADIYALGVMIYQMITGELPRGVWKPPSQRAPVLPEWDDIVAHAMQSDPKDRYQQASEVKTDLSRITPSCRASVSDACTGTPDTKAAQPSHRDGLQSAAKKSNAPLIFGFITGAVVIALGAFFAFHPVEDDVRSPAVEGEVTSPMATGGPVTADKGLVTSSSTGAAKQTLDLIALVDVQRDRLNAQGNAGANQWTKIGGQLAFASVDKRAGKIAAPVALNGLRDYEVEIGIPATTESIGLDLPMSVSSQATVVFVPGQVVLLRDGNTSKEFGTWPKDAASPPWKLAARVKFDADGTNGTLSATVNGTAVGEWRGALGKLGKTPEPHPDFPGQLVPALYIRSGASAHSSWTLRVFDGEAKVLRGAIAAVSPSPNLPVSKSSATTATKDAPFVNTLGMKFVPVPITGGPTGGQRVLFSVWDTRVQDYEAFAKETKRQWPKPDFEQGPTHPAVNVSWDDATAFSKWLTERERKAGKLAADEAYRLPTDHEWSCAVGIGESEDAAKTPEEKNWAIPQRYPWGVEWPPPPNSGNYWSEELRPLASSPQYKIVGEIKCYHDGFATTSPVGTYAANPFGLFDIGGNVWQWCEDWWNKEQQERVLRGASWRNLGTSLPLSSSRVHDKASKGGNNNGFRCVLVHVPTAK